MPKVAQDCGNCGTSFESWPSAHRRFCSKSCHGKAQGLLLWAERKAKMVKGRSGRDVACPACGTTTYRDPTELKKNRRFCSNECRTAYADRELTIKNCKSCGKEMRLRPYHAYMDHCSKVCRNKSMTYWPQDRVHNGRPVRKDRRGYILIWEPEHPNKLYGGYQYEHRMVVEAEIGRYLSSDEHVDHINTVRDDNRSENLQVLSKSDHSIKTAADRKTYLDQMKADLAEYRRRYGPLT